MGWFHPTKSREEKSYAKATSGSSAHFPHWVLHPWAKAPPGPLGSEPSVGGGGKGGGLAPYRGGVNIGPLFPPPKPYIIYI